MKLSLAAIPYYWPKNAVFDFYDRQRNADWDVVYLGETVCAKRAELSLDDWLAIADMLQQHNKRVVLSTLALVTARSETQMLKRISDQGMLVEANDVAAVQLLSERGQPFVCGSSINIYNAATLQHFCRLGMQRWVVPVELSADNLQSLLQSAAAQSLNVETEILGLGKLPLAYSARCFTARAHNRAKDQCKKICLDYPAGMPLLSQEQQRLFTLNGIQTLSGNAQDLRAQIPQMRAMGVTMFRVVPEQGMSLDSVAETRAIVDEQARPSLIASDACNGYWLGQAGMARLP